MTISIHQPHFLPWLGYVNKVLHSDVFVWLDSVQYRKNYYQNRTKIKNVNEQSLWLTLPVHAPFGTRIDKVEIVDARWRERVHKTVEQCYRKTPFFDENWPLLAKAMADSSDNLAEVNLNLFSALLDLLVGSSIRIEKASAIPSSTEDPTLRLVEICSTLGATHYIAGRGGRNYLRVEEFQKAGIEVLWQEFDVLQCVYPQRGNAFLPGLSVIDCLFNLGVGASRDIVKNAWKP